MLNTAIEFYVAVAAVVAIYTLIQDRNIGIAVRTGATWPVAIFKCLKVMANKAAYTIKGRLNKK